MFTAKTLGITGRPFIKPMSVKAGTGRGSHTRTLSKVSTSTFLGVLQGRGSFFSSTAKLSRGRALRDGFLRSEPTSDSNFRFRGGFFSLFFCRGRAELGRRPTDYFILTRQACTTRWLNVERANLRGGEPQQARDGAQICKELGQLKHSNRTKKSDNL